MECLSFNCLFLNPAFSRDCFILRKTSLVFPLVFNRLTMLTVTIGYVYWCPSPSTGTLVPDPFQRKINKRNSKRLQWRLLEPLDVFQILGCCPSIELCACFSNTSSKRRLFRALRCFRRRPGHFLGNSRSLENCTASFHTSSKSVYLWTNSQEMYPSLLIFLLRLPLLRFPSPLQLSIHDWKRNSSSYPIRILLLRHPHPVPYHQLLPR